eukprot:TRINITY_DN20949_c0_g1_i1.p1 TRINITY_DN20949_c0_g1~~TRINITY_DN20949_c0_g1_i1.p1  ORF type:complete len:764 (-),score=127.23 TRINITY_DN20949_c0_g1_i1:1400-3691(-)
MGESPQTQSCEAPSPKDAPDETRIKVFIRLRPLSKEEAERGEVVMVEAVDPVVCIQDVVDAKNYLQSKLKKGKQYSFDRAFSSSATQEEVYNASTANLVDSVLSGNNASVFCYGATGAGKTHTMLGTTSDPGVMLLALRDLFLKLKTKQSTDNVEVRLSYLEVYNEEVHDLLTCGRRPLVLRTDGNMETSVTGLSHASPQSAEEVMELLQAGNRKRKTEATRSNQTSSRSHAILQISVKYDDGDESEGRRFRRAGKLSLIDLAGSERATASEGRSARSREGAAINKSLFAVSSCIRALVKGQAYVPYRDSKLTQLLKDSLGGKCQTAMIANISPSHCVLAETGNTLHWADRVKEIRHKAIDVSLPPVFLPPKGSATAALRTPTSSALVSAQARANRVRSAPPRNASVNFLQNQFTDYSKTNRDRLSSVDRGVTALMASTSHALMPTPAGQKAPHSVRRRISPMLDQGQLASHYLTLQAQQSHNLLEDGKRMAGHRLRYSSSSGAGLPGELNSGREGEGEGDAQTDDDMADINELLGIIRGLEDTVTQKDGRVKELENRVAEKEKEVVSLRLKEQLMQQLLRRSTPFLREPSKEAEKPKRSSNSPTSFTPSPLQESSNSTNQRYLSHLSPSLLTNSVASAMSTTGTHPREAHAGQEDKENKHGHASESKKSAAVGTPYERGKAAVSKPALRVQLDGGGGTPIASPSLSSLRYELRSQGSKKPAWVGAGACSNNSISATLGKRATPSPSARRFPWISSLRSGSSK